MKVKAMNSGSSSSRLYNLSIRAKLATLAAFSALVLVSLSSYLLWQQYQSTYESRKVAIKQSVEIAVSIVDWAYRQEVSGQLTRPQAQAMAVRAVNDARYAGKEYFWINDMAPVMVTHPFKPEMNGKELSSFKDPNGNPIFVQFVEIVSKENAGYLSYLWPKPGQDKPVEKVFCQWFQALGLGAWFGPVHGRFAHGLHHHAGPGRRGDRNRHCAEHLDGSWDHP